MVNEDKIIKPIVDGDSTAPVVQAPSVAKKAEQSKLVKITLKNLAGAFVNIKSMPTGQQILIAGQQKCNAEGLSGTVIGREDLENEYIKYYADNVEPVSGINPNTGVEYKIGDYVSKAKY